MNFGEIVEVVAEKAGIEKKEIRTIIKEFLDEIKNQIKNDNIVRIRGFGTFKPKIVKGREVSTPKGNKVKFDTYKTIKLKSSIKL